MIAIISPAKNMRASALPGLVPDRPGRLAQTKRLAGILKELSPWQLESLMKINPELALGAFDAFQAFDPAKPGFPALLSYDGLQYKNLQAEDFSPADFSFADEHLRIVSAFYGLLRPSDGIQPYRLELQCRLKVDGKSLYAFWGDALYRELFAAGNPVVNLASAEYAKVIRSHLTPADPFITVNFLVRKRQKLTCLPTFAKMARGRMARMIVKERLTKPQQLRSFHWDGFSFAENLSDDFTYTFVREA
ncbi:MULTISPECIES: peroxide stress protein YaaA [Anaerotruncus]|uniref:peroxide stress protein YaaA n=1 Tax=Anaerotruncus TaxID=244127 RepID=UPI000E5271B7|nr:MULTISPECIES: peroxide stress protein YaaA [Anaerotruncus]RGX55921.1 peroxide stress protein YaaA [Anaerotruncus sp. AF02-27]